MKFIHVTEMRLGMKALKSTELLYVYSQITNVGNIAE
jgi:hypothetical protein